MLVAASGTTSPETTGRLYCNMLSVSIGLAHYRRALDWSDEAVSWCAAHSDSSFPGLCQVYRSSLSRRLGRLREVVADLEVLTTSPFSYVAGGALLELGAIHLRLGELDEAETALLAAHGHGHDATAGLAELALARGRPADAQALAAGGLADAADPVAAYRLLPIVVEAAAVAGDLSAACAAATDLGRLAEHGSEAVVAAVRRANGTIAFVQGDDERASEELRGSVATFTELGLVHDAAQTRLGVAASARRAGAHHVADVEVAAAERTLEEIGARPFGIAAQWSQLAHRAPTTR